MKKNKKIIIYLINALLIILIGVSLWLCSSYGRTLVSQRAAESWAGESDERFAQISCFFSINADVDENTIFSFRNNIDKKLIEAGVEPKTEGENWADAYSAIGSVEVEGERGSSNTTAIGVGGNFFMFHPYPLLSGGYIYDSDLMKDRVVLDYDLSWKLFGGTQLEGMTVKINGKPYYVAGVIQRETDKFTKKAFTGEPVIFMSYSAFAELNEEAEIGCYELSMPDPISEFSKITATEGFASSEPVVVENSKRFGFMNIYNIFKNFGSRSVADKGVIYPYWENAARVAEIYIARLYVIIALLAAFPFICLIILLVRLIKLLKAKLKLLGLKLWDAWDDRYARRAARQERRMMKRRFKNLPPSEEEQFDEHSDENEISVNEGKGKSLKPIKKIGDAFKKKFSGISSEDKKSRRTTKQQGAHKDAEEPEILSEKEIAMDIESIVREIMNESADSGFDGKS